MGVLSSRAHAVIARAPDDVSAVRSEWMLDIALRLRLAAPLTAPSGSAIILGGDARGPLLNGEVLPGALEWSQDPARGVLHLSARYDLQDEHGLRIHVADSATVAIKNASGHWEGLFPTSPDLQLISGAATACPHGLYLGRMDARQLDAGKLRLNVHRVV